MTSIQSGPTPLSYAVPLSPGGVRQERGSSGRGRDDRDEAALPLGDRRGAVDRGRKHRAFDGRAASREASRRRRALGAFRGAAARCRGGVRGGSRGRGGACGRHLEVARGDVVSHLVRLSALFSVVRVWSRRAGRASTQTPGYSDRRARSRAAARAIHRRTASVPTPQNSRRRRRATRASSTRDDGAVVLGRVRREDHPR